MHVGRAFCPACLCADRGDGRCRLGRLYCRPRNTVFSPAMDCRQDSLMDDTIANDIVPQKATRELEREDTALKQKVTQCQKALQDTQRKAACDASQLKSKLLPALALVMADRGDWTRRAKAAQTSVVAEPEQRGKGSMTSWSKSTTMLCLFVTFMNVSSRRSKSNLSCTRWRISAMRHARMPPVPSTCKYRLLPDRLNRPFDLWPTHPPTTFLICDASMSADTYECYIRLCPETSLSSKPTMSTI